MQKPKPAKVMGNVAQFIHAYKRMLVLAKPEWKTLTWGTFFLALASSMALIFPSLIGDVVNSAVDKGMEAINRAALAMLIIFVVQGIAGGLRGYLFTIAGFRIVTQLRSDAYSRIIDQEIGFFDQRKTGELLSRLTADTAVLQNTVSVNISMFLRSLSMCLGSIIFLFVTSVKLGGLMLLVLPPIILSALWFGRAIRRLSRLVQDALAKAGEVAEETIAGIRTVRSFAKERHEAKRYHDRVFDALHAVRKRILAESIFIGFITFIGFGIIALVLWVGGQMVVDGVMNVGDLTSFLIYTLFVAQSMGTLGSLWGDFMRAIGAADRIFEIMDREPAIDNDGGRKLENVAGLLEFRDVSFAYPSRSDVVAIKNLNLKIEPGEVVALVGPSGSGKSTIASLIPRFYDPNSGAILLDGHALGELNPHWLRSQIGTVSQEPSLFSTTLSENIGYGRDQFEQEDVVKAAMVANAHDFIEDFPEKYDTEVGERGVKLSGGQKQRVAIARAVLKDPRILILDEATSALDAESEHLVKQALDRLMRGRTTLVIAHRLSTVKDADRVIVLDRGRILETGTHEELMGKDQSMYRRLVERQFMAESSAGG